MTLSLWNIFYFSGSWILVLVFIHQMLHVPSPYSDRMESFPETCSRMLRLFGAILNYRFDELPDLSGGNEDRASSSTPFTWTRLVQLTLVNVFAVDNARAITAQSSTGQQQQQRDRSQAITRSALLEDAVLLGLDMFALLCDRGTQLLTGNALVTYTYYVRVYICFYMKY